MPTLRKEVSCPYCGNHPPVGAIWQCQCGCRFDAFRFITPERVAATFCTSCGESITRAECGHCETLVPLHRWHPVSRAAEAARLQRMNEQPALVVSNPADPERFEALRAARERVALVAARPLTSVLPIHPVVGRWAERARERQERE